MSDYDNATAEPSATDNVVAMPTSEDWSILWALAPMGRLSDAEADTVAGSQRACWALRIAWEDDPPDTRVLAEVVRSRAGMRRLIQKVHLDTQTDNARQTAQRLREIEALAMVRPRLLDVLADNLDSHVTSFDPNGEQILSRFDVPGGSLSQFTSPPPASARALPKEGGVVLEITFRDDVHDAFCLAAAYQTPSQPDQSADAEPQLLSVSPLVEYHSGLYGRPTFQMPSFEIPAVDMVRLFTASAPPARHVSVQPPPQKTTKSQGTRTRFS